MLDPIAFSLFGRPIYWYGIFFALGFLAAVIHWSLLGRREGRTADQASDLALWIMVGGVLGARLNYVGANLESYRGAWGQVFRIDQGGLIYYGGMLGVVLAVVLFARRRKESPWSLGDFVITAAPLGHGLGRIGCFINGCCHGKVCDAGFAFAVRYGEKATQPFTMYPPVHGDPTNLSQPLYPVQLMEALANLAVYAFLLLVYRRHAVHGRVVAAYLLVYPLVRFATEFFRGDKRMTWEGYTAAQQMSFVLFAAGILLWFLCPRFKENRDAPA